MSLIADIQSLHENALVAWDRDCGEAIRSLSSLTRVHSWLIHGGTWSESNGRIADMRYDGIGAVYETGRIRRVLINDPKDILRIRWLVIDESAES